MGIDTLSNLSIESTLWRHAFLKRRFLGCFSADTLPLTHSPPYGLIVNFDKQSEVGSHWVAIFVPSEHVIEYFDSLGNPPPIGDIRKFVEKFPDRRIYSLPIQSLLSSGCGQYAVYFVVHRILGVSAQSTLARLCRYPSKADDHVREFYFALKQ